MIIERKSTLLQIVFDRLKSKAKVTLKRILFDLKYRKLFKNIKLQKNTKNGKKLLVIGNGISSLKLEGLNIDRSNIEVMVVNGYHRTKLAKIVKPNYYLISDPNYFDSSKVTSRIRDNNLKQYCSETCAEIILPLQYYSGDDLEKLAFCDIYDPYSNFNEDILKPYNHLSMSAYKALRVSLYLGYDEIGIIGLDNDYIKCYEVDANNRISYCVPHTDYEKRIFVDEDQYEDGFGQNIGALIYHESFLFIDLDDFPKTKFVNLNQHGLITSFKKVDPATWCKCF